RRGCEWALERLQRDADDPQIRAAALLAFARAREDRAAVGTALDDQNESVRMAALVGCVSAGWMVGDAAAGSLAVALNEASPAGRLALALAIRQRPSPLFEETLMQLAVTTDLRLRLHVAEAMARQPSVRFLPALRAMLCESELREPAIAALVPLGT